MIFGASTGSPSRFRRLTGAVCIGGGHQKTFRIPTMLNKRLLFASIHSYLDPSSGAALATRELLELLAARGWDCRALSCGVLDYQNETPLEDVLAAIERPTARVGAALSRGGEAEVYDLALDGVRVTLMPTAYSRAERAPGPREGAIFLDLFDQVLDRFRPEVILTYGGHPVCLELMRRARVRGIAVVFHLHNFGYNDRRGFTDVSAVIFLRSIRAGIIGSGLDWMGPSLLTRCGLIRSLPRTPSQSMSHSLTRNRRKERPFLRALRLSWDGGGRIFRCWWSRGAGRRMCWRVCRWICRGSRTCTGWPIRLIREISTG